MKMSHLQFLVSQQPVTIRKACILLFFLVGWIGSRAQHTPEIDSLIEVVKAGKEDTSKMYSMMRLGSKLMNAALLEESAMYLDSSLSLAQKLNNKKGIAETHFYMGLMNATRGNFSLALQHQQTSLDLMQETGNKAGMANAYNAIGVIYMNLGDQTKALKYYLLSLEISNELHNKISIAKSSYNIGLIHKERANYPEALTYFLTALKTSEELGNKQGMAKCYGGIGAIHQDQGNYEESLKNYRRSLELYKEIGFKIDIANDYLFIGLVKKDQKKNEEALSHIELGLSMHKEIGDTPGIAGAYLSKGAVQDAMGQRKEALENYFAALEIYEEIGDKTEITNCYFNIGTDYTSEKKFTEANQYLQRALTLALETGNNYNICDTYAALSRLDEAKGNYQDALKQYKMAMLYKDSSWNEAKSQQIAFLNEQYESEKKDKEIELLNNEKVVKELELNKQKQTKTYLMAGIALLTILSLFVYRLYHTRQELKVLRLRNKIASDLHDDVGSTLSSISIFSEIARAQSREVIPALETIRESSKKMLDAMADIVWTINPENDEFEKIIMRMRSFAYELLGASNIEFEFLVEEEVSKINLPMQVRKNIYLIFKEALNNLVKYAKADKALFTIKRKDDMLTMMIRDNGKGFDATNEFSGNGLKNIKRRANEIEAQLLIDSFPGSGTTIKLELAV
jgi:signal transduction histidine kinase